VNTIPLIDSRVVAQTFAMRREVVEPAPRPESPILTNCQAYGSVLRDAAGAWRMWYLSDPGYCEYFATSDDGLRWDRPELDLVCEEVRPGTAGPNAFMSRRQKDAAGRWLVEVKGPEGFCVLDAAQHPHPAARSRFMALYLARFGGGEDRFSGLCLAHSEDGVRWTADERNPIMPGWRDTANQLLYDERIRKYVWYGRPEICVGAVTRANRLIARAESEDLVHWSPERIVLDTDPADADAFDIVDEGALRDGAALTDARARIREWARVTEGAVLDVDKPMARGRSRQWYGITVFPVADLYLALGWLYDIPAGEIWIELCHSYDGIIWRREPLRRPFIPAHPGTTTCTMSTPPIVAGDEAWIYFSHSDRNHHGVTIPDADAHPRGIYVRTIERDRWAAYTAGDHDGELLTQVLPRPDRLSLNASVGNDGWVRVEVLDAAGAALDGFLLDQSRPLAGDGLDLIPTWTSGRTLADVRAANIRLRLTARRASVYALNL